MLITGSGDIHLLWVDNEGGFVGLEDIFYGNSDLGLPIEGVSIVDELGTEQRSPSIAANDERVFACWRDSRNVLGNADTDIYYAETGSDFGTNILVNDDVGANTQTAPVIGTDKYGNPYMGWVDNRLGNNDIYGAASTSIGPPFGIEINAASGGTVEIDDTREGIVDD